VARRLLIIIHRARRPLLRKILAGAWTVAVLAGVIVLMMMLLPVIGFILAVMLGALVGVILVAGVAAVVFGWKLRRQLRKASDDPATERDGRPPRKKVKVNIRSED